MVRVGATLVAGRESMACASLASRRSKTGSPSAGGTLRHTQATVPPMESDSDLTCGYGEGAGEGEGEGEG